MFRGTNDGELVIDDEQVKVVRGIFRWYLDGASVLGIIKKLSDAGIPSPPPIITESVYRTVQEEKKKRSNIATGDDGTRRSSEKYSSKKKK